MVNLAGASNRLIIVLQALRKTVCTEQDIIDCSTEDMLTFSRYRQINDRYQMLIARQNYTKAKENSIHTLFETT